MGHPLSCDTSFCFPSQVTQSFIALFLPGQVSRTHPRFRHASLQTGFASGAYLPPKARALEPCLPWPKQLLPQTFDITKHRIIKYGQSEHSDGCLHGSYLHTLECRQRFNRLLDGAEPLPRGEDDQVSGGGDTHEDRVDDVDQIFRLFDTVTPQNADVEPVDPLVSDLVPECPPRSEEEDDGLEPSVAPSLPESETSSAESFLDPSIIGEVIRIPGGAAIRNSNGILIEFCCREGSSMPRVAEAVGVT